MIKTSQESSCEKINFNNDLGSARRDCLWRCGWFFTNIRLGVSPQDYEIQTLYDNYIRIGGTSLKKLPVKSLPW